MDPSPAPIHSLGPESPCGCSPARPPWVRVGGAATIEAAVEDRQGPHGVPQVVRWAPKLVPAGEVLEHHDFGCAEPGRGGQLGGSRPSSTLAKSRQAITALMVTARSIWWPSRWLRNSALHPRSRHVDPTLIPRRGIRVRWGLRHHRSPLDRNFSRREGLMEPWQHDCSATQTEKISPIAAGLAAWDRRAR